MSGIGRRLLAGWANKGTAGMSWPGGETKGEKAARLAAGMRTGRVHAHDRAALRWLMQGTGPVQWHRLCARGRLRPSQLRRAVREVMTARQAGELDRWTERQRARGDRIPWTMEMESTWLYDRESGEMERVGKLLAHEEGQGETEPIGDGTVAGKV